MTQTDTGHTPNGAPHAQPSPDLERLSSAASRVLRGGVVLSACLMVLGLLIAVLRAPPIGPRPSGLGWIARGILHADGRAILELGLLVLMFTPVLRMLMVAYYFARARIVLLFLASAGVLAILGFSIIARFE
jgi:uncharacterized membrane protein